MAHSSLHNRIKNVPNMWAEYTEDEEGKEISYKHRVIQK